MTDRLLACPRYKSRYKSPRCHATPPQTGRSTRPSTGWLSTFRAAPGNQPGCALQIQMPTPWLRAPLSFATHPPPSVWAHCHGGVPTPRVACTGSRRGSPRCLRPLHCLPLSCCPSAANNSAAENSAAENSAIAVTVTATDAGAVPFAFACCDHCCRYKGHQQHQCLRPSPYA